MSIAGMVVIMYHVTMMSHPGNHNMYLGVCDKMVNILFDCNYSLVELQFLLILIQNSSISNAMCRVGMQHLKHELMNH